MEEIQSQIKYLSKRFNELVGLCGKDTTPEVSEEVRNVAQDIITRLNRLLDNILYTFFEKEIRPLLSTEQAEIYESKVQFPICNKFSDLKARLGSFGATSLEESNPPVFELIEKIQPYHSGNDWLSHLRKYSNLGHRKLLAQNKKREISLVLSEVVRISGEASVTMRNCFIQGVPIKHLTVDKGKVSGDLDPRLNPRVEVKVSYLLEGENIDLLELCEDSIKKIQEISQEFEKII